MWSTNGVRGRIVKLRQSMDCKLRAVTYAVTYENYIIYGRDQAFGLTPCSVRKSYFFRCWGDGGGGVGNLCGQFKHNAHMSIRHLISMCTFTWCANGTRHILHGVHAMHDIETK